SPATRTRNATGSWATRWLSRWWSGSCGGSQQRAWPASARPLSLLLPGDPVQDEEPPFGLDGGLVLLPPSVEDHLHTLGLFWCHHARIPRAWHSAQQAWRAWASRPIWLVEFDLDAKVS